MQPRNDCPGVDMSRWKYKTEDVTVGENTQKVRGMMHGERNLFALASAEIKEGKRKATELPGMIAGFGCIEPPCTPEDVANMPAELLDAVVSKIMELSGMRDQKKAPAPDLPTFPALEHSQADDDKAPEPPAWQTS